MHKQSIIIDKSICRIVKKILIMFPLGFGIQVEDMDKFMMEKIKKKLSLKCCTKLSLAWTTLIVNQVLRSTLWYFITSWVQFRKVMQQFRMLLHNYLWAKREHMIHRKIKWKDCYVV
jgi:hypothetical protein